uniref:Uncharacterized protein n=1 Tax=Rhizophagus irregularis (strain DAOM 181602 / DAOM 197198 / MUCL 43194) TaxID=747089 RepID=U9TSM7_RHIID
MVRNPGPKTLFDLTDLSFIISIPSSDLTTWILIVFILIKLDQIQNLIPKKRLKNTFRSLR